MPIGFIHIRSRLKPRSMKSPQYIEVCSSPLTQLLKAEIQFFKLYLWCSSAFIEQSHIQTDVIDIMELFKKSVFTVVLFEIFLSRFYNFHIDNFFKGDIIIPKWVAFDDLQHYQRLTPCTKISSQIKFLHCMAGYDEPWYSRPE